MLHTPYTASKTGPATTAVLIKIHLCHPGSSLII